VQLETPVDGPNMPAPHLRQLIEDPAPDDSEYIPAGQFMQLDIDAEPVVDE